MLVLCSLFMLEEKLNHQQNSRPPENRHSPTKTQRNLKAYSANTKKNLISFEGLASLLLYKRDLKA